MGVSYQPILFIYCLLVRHRIGNSHVGDETYSLHMFQTVGTFLPVGATVANGESPNTRLLLFISSNRAPQTGWSRFAGPGEVSNEKRAPGCLGYIGDYTTQLYGDYSKPV